MTASDQALDSLALAARAADSKGGEDLVALDVSGPLPFTDVFLLVTGNSERNVVAIRARRAPARQDGDEVIIDERPYGEFTRQLFLGDNLDAGRMTADLRDGVLRLTIPVSEESKPRRIPLGSSGDQQPAEVSTSTG